MDFGQAIAALKRGERVSRVGWNGKGMWLSLREGHKNFAPEGATHINGVPIDLFENGRGTHHIMPCIEMRAADGSTVVGWLASQTDMLAEDWDVV